MTRPLRTPRSAALVPEPAVSAEPLPDILAFPSLDAAPTLVTHSPRLQAVIAQAQQVAPSKAAVLVEGESGTGKELLAQLVFQASTRVQAPFVRVNCAAFSEGLIESELFGHTRGAFTGADYDHAGRFERAHGGTLLLDEIGELPLKLQAKLLRVLEQEEFERVGGERTLRCDVRVIATTNRNLDAEAAHGRFRRDLYYRLSTIELRLPPLRERPEDLGPLVQHFIERFRGDGPAGVRDIAPAALQLLEAYSWPGNVRQLRNVIQRACILATEPILRVADLPALREPGAAPAEAGGQTLAEIERRVILQTLHTVGGNKTVAAQRLGVTARTLLNKLNKYRSESAANGHVGADGSA